ncbi:hypothetical protein Acor_80740 [Acrocarpospora corrugata]|uniref:SAF domain-containing protein n=1 Tax=Acrocarpospora corrugata TaxID=35763 RepID=A0A5M3WAB9_9ACTN|nr:SAF domain-containing protein [Acrocarpospora corrugata]GES06005.1 hypothetical protein Acor_80740 [Acrocarpospora corrugata]
MRALVRFFGRRRRLLAAMLAGSSVACALLAVSGSKGVDVLAAARDLPGGRLSAGDVVVLRLPSTALPDGVLRPGVSVAGRVLTGPIRRGEPMTDVRLLGRGLLAGQSPGVVATPVRIADADAAQLVSPGDVIDVLAATSGSSYPSLGNTAGIGTGFVSDNNGPGPEQPNAESGDADGVVNTIDIVPAGAASSQFDGGGQVVSRVTVLAGTAAGDRSEGALLVLATTSWQAAQLAFAQSHGQLSIAIHPR